MCQWWTTQVGGGIGVRAGIGLPRIAPHLPRCYYVPAHWFSRLTEDGGADHQKVARWTVGVNVFQDYDVILIPIIRNYHWYLGVIDLANKVTVVSPVRVPLRDNLSTVHNGAPPTPRIG
jgi:Ulp1 family protease